jgi:hypothetical protein
MLTENATLQKPQVPLNEITPPSYAVDEQLAIYTIHDVAYYCDLHRLNTLSVTKQRKSTVSSAHGIISSGS